MFLKKIKIKKKIKYKKTILLIKVNWKILNNYKLTPVNNKINFTQNKILKFKLN